jgi:hypothetical protein
MKLEKYVLQLEKMCPSDVVKDIKDWPVETKLYMYLHTIQISYMHAFIEKIDKLLDKDGVQ